MTDTAPQTHTEALTQALTLAITAPNEEQAQACVAMADRLAASLTPEQIQACQAAAQIAAGI